MLCFRSTLRKERESSGNVIQAYEAANMEIGELMAKLAALREDRRAHFSQVNLANKHAATWREAMMEVGELVADAPELLIDKEGKPTEIRQLFRVPEVVKARLDGLELAEWWFQEATGRSAALRGTQDLLEASVNREQALNAALDELKEERRLTEGREGALQTTIETLQQQAEQHQREKECFARSEKLWRGRF